MSPLLHLLLIPLSAVALLRLRTRPRMAWLIVPLAISPLVLAPFPDLRELVLGKEQPVEVLTEGILLAVVIRWRRSRWIVLPAVLLLLEEVDYGQVFLPFPTPEWILELPGNRSDNANLHNVTPFDGLWRMGPLLGVLLLSLRPWPERLERLARRLSLPHIEPLA